MQHFNGWSKSAISNPTPAVLKPGMRATVWTQFLFKTDSKIQVSMMCEAFLDLLRNHCACFLCEITVLWCVFHQNTILFIKFLKTGQNWPISRCWIFLTWQFPDLLRNHCAKPFMFEGHCVWTQILFKTPFLNFEMGQIDFGKNFKGVELYKRCPGIFPRE